MQPWKRSLWALFENALPWVTLAVVVFFNFAYLVLKPYAGLNVNPDSGHGIINPFRHVSGPVQGEDPVSQAEYLHSLQALLQQELLLLQGLLLVRGLLLAARIAVGENLSSFTSSHRGDQLFKGNLSPGKVLPQFFI
jgi:hypothetical protein